MLCQSCGAAIQSTDTVCGNCGARLSPAAPTVETPPGSWTPVATAPSATRLYSPTVVTLYTLLTLPIGLSLHGVNAYRRGRRLAGLMWLAGALVFISVAILPSGPAPPGMTLGLSILLAGGLWKAEDRRWKRDQESGASAARWWPPLLIAAVVLFGIGVVLVAVDPLLTPPVE